MEKYIRGQNERLRQSIPYAVEKAKMDTAKQHRDNLAMMDKEHAKHMTWQKEKLASDTKALENDLTHQNILIAQKELQEKRNS